MKKSQMKRSRTWRSRTTRRRSGVDADVLARRCRPQRHGCAVRGARKQALATPANASYKKLIAGVGPADVDELWAKIVARVDGQHADADAAAGALASESKVRA
ncbi:hypothetical protein [Amycolatopsis sp. FDAARGOS 1241]|uniref:hypothetical protein n=1 Tax=Amycolatopsis sp. FDAARGOS 1241 TaxID=2778070 RepID=UPI00194FD06E|nr:hypothetical protein [Amycolatopsis sp. FDAARGOS 1241]QRP49044.1 hypothetical protein I6J71_15330 [Amycolatopsis sp. FDAARGOS 1241]